MDHAFFKYHGAGNDFIIFDNRSHKLHLNAARVAQLCHRRLGIGADGLMLLQDTDEADFEMIYYNADGQQSSLCGNGGRCITHFAIRKLKIGSEKIHFLAADGLHVATLLDNNTVALQMQDVKAIHEEGTNLILDTGSPHYVQWVEGLKNYPVFEEGRRIRYMERFAPGGINVNFVERKDDILYLRTYERGVEAETLACGTGVTATAIASAGKATGHFSIALKTQNGDLFHVDFQKESPGVAKDIKLTGPVCFVFEGKVTL